MYRYLLSRVLNFVYTRFLALPYHDLSDGFRLYSRRLLDDVAEPTSTDFDVLQEILIKGHIGGRRIREVPFQYQPRITGDSKAHIFKFGIAYLKTLAQMWVEWYCAL